MKHIILGTAGHIDHGKTTLVKALTNIDCDTHKEEKVRGITINLGFAHLELPDGNSIGIVDVPGHSDFINTMVAGASGIDIVMLVIAADSGVMPQTVEHLRIMETLGIKKGFVVLTKTDLVSNELVEMAEVEIRDLLKETFLEGCKIIKAALIEADKEIEYGGIGYNGIEEIKNVLMKMMNEIEERKKGEIFRLFIDRIFSVKGHGTVITGSVLSGQVKVEDKVFLLPVGKELRVRRIERHGSEVVSVTAGDRASLNLVGLSRDDFKRGMCLSDRELQPTKMLDAKLSLFQPNKNFQLWYQTLFLLGTFQSRARIHLIDTDKISTGEKAIVQIHLDDNCIAQIGDRFVIRSTSGDYTLGGGEVIDAHPLHHRRRTEKLINKLQKISEGGLPQKISAEVQKSIHPLPLIDIAEVLNISLAEAIASVEAELPPEIYLLRKDENIFLIAAVERERIAAKILKNLGNYHKRNPLDEGGRKIEELLGILGIGRNSVSEIALTVILDELKNRKEIKKIGRTWALESHNVKLSTEERNQIQLVENYLIGSGMKTPLMNEMITEAKKNKVDEVRLVQILQMLVSQKKVYNIEGSYIHADIIDNSRVKLLDYLAQNDAGITVAQFRDLLVNANRKICLLMFSQFDSEGITIRSGDNRLITKKGLEKYQEIQSKIS